MIASSEQQAQQDELPILVQAEQRNIADAPQHLAPSRQSSLQSSSPPPRHLRNMSSVPSFVSTGTTTSLVPKLKYAVMTEYLQQVMLQRRWLSNPSSSTEGAFVKLRQGEYVALPEMHREVGTDLYRAIAALNTPAAMTVSLPIVTTFLEHHPYASDVPLSNDLCIQVLPSFFELSRPKVHQYAAFISSEKLLVVWDDDALHLESRVSKILADLTRMVWTRSSISMKGSASDGGEAGGEVDVRKDVKTEHTGTQERKTQLINALLVALTLCLIMVMLGAGWRALAIECSIDHQYLRFLLLLVGPIQIFFTLFFAQVIIGCVAQIIGPIAQMSENSRFYSGQRSPRLHTRCLPHVTIQCPVYREDLHATIAPTIASIKAAISTYELQGGSANLFINDDGIQSLPNEQQEARRAFYENNGMGWTARPNHGAVLRDGSVFVKKGKFKKASNMNYGLAVSCRIEQLLSKIPRDAHWTDRQEQDAYVATFSRVLSEEYADAWASGNIRIGDYILLIDSDTRVPHDCFLDAVSEMEQSPEVGILQFTSGVMQVQKDYFENGITFFTNLIYTAIRYTVANGDVAPFVGHNALLRWSAVQSVAQYGSDSTERDAKPSQTLEASEASTHTFWSESHVSEDFDMSLRLQCAGYTVRLASWADDSTNANYEDDIFKEGVSLTVYDELARWEKYAFGCSELLFHPFSQWFSPHAYPPGAGQHHLRFLPRGPFTPLFKHFLLSRNIAFTSKITILSYIGTYYAIGAAWVLTLGNYFAVGWYSGWLDGYYIDSWKVWVGLLVVFNGLGNLGLATMRYRDERRAAQQQAGGEGEKAMGVAKRKGFLGHLLTNFKHTFLLCIFLGGLSLHVSAALLSHMVGYNMTWGATSKEARVTNFFQEAPAVVRRFKVSFLFSISGFVAMGVLGTGAGGLVRHDWRITDMVAIVPLATLLASHFMLPVVLNPGLMTFSY